MTHEAGYVYGNIAEMSQGGNQRRRKKIRCLKIRREAIPPNIDEKKKTRNQKKKTLYKALANQQKISTQQCGRRVAFVLLFLLSFVRLVIAFHAVIAGTEKSKVQSAPAASLVYIMIGGGKANKTARRKNETLCT